MNSDLMDEQRSGGLALPGEGYAAFKISIQQCMPTKHLHITCCFPPLQTALLVLLGT